MHITKVPDEFDMDIYKKKRQSVETACPYCGNTEDNDYDVEYDLRHTNKRLIFYEHKCKFKERFHEIGLHGMIFRRYHIMYITATCEKCGAEWRSNMFDDDNPTGKFEDDAGHDISGHIVDIFCLWLLILICLGFAAILVLAFTQG